jgi:hypothetical protein
LRRFGGVPESEIMSLPWDEFLEELEVACRFEGFDR